MEFGRRCLKWQEAWKSGDYNSFSSLSSWIGKKMEEKEWIGRSRKNIASFFSLVLKTPVSENMDQKELKNFLEQKSRSLLSSPSEDSRINSMIRFIEEHYREDISAADLSERFGLSASYISSLLKTALGVRYSDYVAGLRLNHAKELLATTHMTVKDITVECGWYSQSYFTKLFIEREAVRRWNTGNHLENEHRCLKNEQNQVDMMGYTGIREKKRSAYKSYTV